MLKMGVLAVPCGRAGSVSSLLAAALRRSTHCNVACRFRCVSRWLAGRLGEVRNSRNFAGDRGP